MKGMLWIARVAGCALIFAAAASHAWAQGPDRGWRPDSLVMAVGSTLIFGLLGIVLAILGFKLFDVLTPFSLEKEICEKQNLPVSLLCGAMVLGICIVVAAAVF